MRDRNLMTGVVAVIAVMTVVAALGSTAWLAKAGNVLIPALILGAGVIGFGLYRKQRRER